MLIVIDVTSRRSSRCYFIFCAVFKIVLDCLAPARFLGQSAGDCTWSNALQVHAILVGNVDDWSFHIMGS